MEGFRMKKVLVIIAVCLLWVSHAFAVEIDGPQFVSIEITNNTNDVLQSLVPVTTIYPGRDKIMGYSIMQTEYTANTENYLGIYDSAVTNLTDLEVIDEAETSGAYSANVWFPYEREISKGITVRQGANTIVTIHFVRG